MSEYPLAQVLDVKKKRVDEALLVVQEKTRLLQAAEEKLAKIEAVRDVALNRYREKLTQLRHALDTGENTNKLKDMREFLKIVKDALDKEQAKVKEQKKQVDIAKAQLDLAKRDLQEKRRDVEKIEMHKDLWTKETNEELRRKEGHEQDDLGTIMHIQHRKKKPPPAN